MNPIVPIVAALQTRAEMGRFCAESDSRSRKRDNRGICVTKACIQSSNAPGGGCPPSIEGAAVEFCLPVQWFACMKANAVRGDFKGNCSMHEHDNGLECCGSHGQGKSWNPDRLNIASDILVSEANLPCWKHKRTRKGLSFHFFVCLLLPFIVNGQISLIITSTKIVNVFRFLTGSSGQKNEELRNSEWWAASK